MAGQDAGLAGPLVPRSMQALRPRLTPFLAAAIFVAYERDGQPLGEGEGMARLVVPGDKRGGRHVTRLAHVEARDVGPVASGGGAQ